MEIFDLYDKDRNKLNQTMVRGDVQPEGTYRMVVHICIFNDKGQMLIQQRQPFKNGWSNLWDVTVGGHSSTGEDSATAANRELYEEIGCQMDFSEKRPALTVHWKNPGATKNAQGFDDYYLVRQNLDETQLKLQKEEVQAVKWASENEILKMIEDKTFIPYHPSMISFLFHLSLGSDCHTCPDWTIKN